MEDQIQKSKTPTWPLFAFFISLLICIPLSIWIGMGIAFSGGAKWPYYLIIGIPFIFLFIALYTYFKTIKKESEFKHKWYISILISFIIFPMTFFLLGDVTTSLIRRILFFLSIEVPLYSFYYYFLIPFLIYLVLAYGIASIFDDQKRKTGIIITCIILGILIFEATHIQIEYAQYNCPVKEYHCIENHRAIYANDITKCYFDGCVMGYVHEKQLNSEDCSVLKIKKLYDVCISSSKNN